MATRVFADADALMRGAAEFFLEHAGRAISKHGRFSVALSGGNTPKRAYEILATEAYRSRVDWGRVHFFWGDERCVPPDDSRSNYRMTREALLDHLSLKPEQVHRVRGELPPPEGAKDYESALASYFGAGPVRFDLVLLGLGTNGHTASLFPKTPVLHELKRRAAEVYVAELDMWRVTLTAPVLNAAATAAFLVSGADKADVVREILRGPRDPERLPAQLIRPETGECVWLLDAPAAARLK